MKITNEWINVSHSIGARLAAWGLVTGCLVNMGLCCQTLTQYLASADMTDTAISPTTTTSICME